MVVDAYIVIIIQLLVLIIPYPNVSISDSLQWIVNVEK